jgi:hypothetical protein
MGRGPGLVGRHRRAAAGREHRRVALPQEDGMRYRIVAPTAPSPQARPAEPGLRTASWP